MFDETILFTHIPECENLCRFICKLNDVIIINGSPMSFFCSQIYNCRFIIDTFPEIMAAPMPGTDNYIEIIIENDYFRIKKLQIFLKSENLLCSDSKPVTLENYKECIMYTIKCKLSPTWNKMGQYLCHGNDYLIGNEEINAIKFDLIVTKQGMHIKFHYLKIQMYPLNLEDLQLNPSLMAEFKENPKGFIELGQSWFNVLPSLFKARLLSVSKEIPSGSPFKNYQELRIHWKNMHGYILPENDEEILYYQVHFKAFPDQVFLYPNVCLNSQPPKIINYENNSLICNKFEEDLRKNIYSICGKTLSFVKDNSEKFIDFKIPSTSYFSPARKIKKEYSNSNITPFKKCSSSDLKIIPLSSVFKNIGYSEIGNEKQILKLKQETLNFPKKVIIPENLSTNSSQKLDSIDNLSNVTNKLSPQLSTKILSQYTQSQPIRRKLIFDQKSEDDISQKNETYNNILNQTNYQNSIKRKTPKDKELFDALLEEKADNDILKSIVPSPAKRICISKQKRNPPIMESISKYFKVQKSTLHRSMQTQGNKLQFENLKK